MVRSWRVNFAALWVGQLVTMLAFAAAMPFMPLYIQELGVADARAAAAWAGLLQLCSGLMMAFMSPVWGSLSDRYGPKLMVARSMFIGGSLIGAMAFAGAMWHLLVLRTLQGAFSGTVSASRVLAASIVPRERLGQSMGMIATAAFVGSSFGPLLGGIVADGFGLRACYIVTAALVLAAGVGVTIFVEESFDRARAREARPGFRASFELLRARPDLRAVIVSLFVVQVGQMAVWPVLPLYVGELTGGDAVAATTGTILGATAVASALSSVLAGRLGDALGHRRVLIVCAFAAGALYLPQAFATAPWQLLGIRVLLGIFQGGIVPLAMAIIALEIPGENRGTTMGMTATAMALGNAFGPAIGAGAAGVFGLRAAFVVTAFTLTFLGVWLATRVRFSSPSVLGDAETGD